MDNFVLDDARPVSSVGRVKYGSGVYGLGENMVRVYSSSGKIRVGCISILRFSDQPNGFRAPFPGLLLFLLKQKLGIFIT